MDVLEVYQHIFDIYSDTLGSIPFYKSPDKFRQEIIESIKKEMEQDEIISKIIVTQEGGINVLPLASIGESPEISKSLRKLLMIQGKVLVKALGKQKLQGIINPKLLIYMKRDWLRNDELRLGEFLIKKILV